MRSFLFAGHVEGVIAQPGRHAAQPRLNHLVDLRVERQLMRLLWRQIESIGFSDHGVQISDATGARA